MRKKIQRFYLYTTLCTASNDRAASALTSRGTSLCSMYVLYSYIIYVITNEAGVVCVSNCSAQCEWKCRMQQKINSISYWTTTKTCYVFSVLFVRNAALKQQNNYKLAQTIEQYGAYIFPVESYYYSFDSMLMKSRHQSFQWFIFM